ncbi:MAG: RluA family pseudouridine synthase [Treponema sp.]|nr:RluA family pseudouridine synthase [Treponema sp.]
MKNITVLFEDERLLVLNKPAGLSVQGGSGVDSSLDSLLSQTYKTRPFLVHRLDRDTSGVIVTAKTRESAAACSALFSGRQGGLKKSYLALCAGELNKKGIINETLVIRGREMEARTSYVRLDYADGNGVPSGFSLAQLEPGTGRMHQIRRHLAQSGHPILGDDKYGDFALNKKLKKSLGLKRLLLHASSIYLPPSLVKGGLLISTPLPDHFLDLIEKTGLTCVPFNPVL